MARTAAGATLTARHRTEQLSVRAQSLRELNTVWPTWNPQRPDTFERFLTAGTAIVRGGHAQSALTAGRYYTGLRAVEGVAGAGAIHLAERIGRDQVRGTLTVTAISGLRNALKSGFSLDAAKRAALVMAAGSVTRLVLNGGRDTIMQTARADSRVTRYERVVSGKGCDFCDMLASRGAVYLSEQTAGFEAHDHCGCTPEPQFD